MRAHSEYDFLLSAASTRELYAQHVDDGPDAVALVRAALREDARPELRRNAIVALSASLQERGIRDYAAALDDAALEVVAEGAATLATYGVAATGRLESADAMSALRAHAPRLRDVLGSRDDTARYNAARALRVIADPIVDLAVLLGDESTLVRSEGVSLAATRSLGPGEVTLLDRLARTDPDAALRARVVTVVAAKAPPELAVPVVSAALARNDIDRTTADAVRESRLIGVVPAMLAYLHSHPSRTEWLGALMSFRPTCAARTLTGLVADPASGHAAQEALRALSGHPDWSLEQLEVWAKAQPDDVAPCA